VRTRPNEVNARPKCQGALLELDREFSVNGPIKLVTQVSRRDFLSGRAWGRVHEITGVYVDVPSPQGPIEESPDEREARVPPLIALGNPNLPESPKRSEGDGGLQLRHPTENGDTVFGAGGDDGIPKFKGVRPIAASLGVV
jgi:hypothetical protein